MVRADESAISNYKFKISNLNELEKVEDEGVQTAALTNYLLKKYPHKQWIIDAGALQMMDTALIPKNAILTPHHKEFEQLLQKGESGKREAGSNKVQIQEFAKKYNCMVLLKGEVDMVSDGEKIQEISGGNAGMTKGGTGDVLAGLIAALACKNDPWVATIAGSYINKAAGENLFGKVGYFFNASDLADEIPKVMKNLLVT